MLVCQVTLLLCGIVVAYAQQNDVCTSEICEETGRKFLKNMDSSVNPCDDFYEFACGNFEKNVELKETQEYVDIYTDVTEVVNDQLGNLLNTTSDFNNNGIYKSLKRFYDLCMDEATINARGVEPAVELLKQAGGWPVIETNWQNNSWSYINTEIWMIKNFESTLIDIMVMPDSNDSSKKIIWIDQPFIHPPREYLAEGYNNSVVRVYRRLLVNMAVAFGANRQTAITEQKQTLKFLIALSKITTKLEDRRDMSKSPHMSLKKLKERWGWLDWDKLLNGLLPHGMRPLTDTDQVFVRQPSYLTKLENLLTKFSNRTVANYMMSKAAILLAPLLPRNVQELEKNFTLAMFGAETTGTRWEKCLARVSESFTVAFSSLYVKRYVDNKSKEEASAIASEIRTEVAKVIQEVTWMDQQTKTLAKEKASKMVLFIGYPPELLEDTQLESYHKNLRMSESNFLEAAMDLKRWESDRGWRQLQEPISRSDWHGHSQATIVNSYYYRYTNTMDFPAAILQPPFFNSKLAKNLNLATIGTVIGNGIIHGFDDEGRRHDAEGRLKNWWSDEIIQKFTEQKQCLIDQYGSFIDTKQTQLKVKGINVQGQVISSSGGLNLAYRVFKNLGTVQEPSLPGFENYTTEQMFFMAYGNLWCSKYNDESMRFLIETSTRPPPKFLVNGVLQNFEPFSKAFSCSPGSQMNPEKKCQVW